MRPISNPTLQKRWVSLPSNSTTLIQKSAHIRNHKTLHQNRSTQPTNTVGGKSFSRLISTQRCLSHSGHALSIHSIIIPHDVGNSKLTKGGLRGSTERITKAIVFASPDATLLSFCRLGRAGNSDSHSMHLQHQDSYTTSLVRIAERNPTLL